jgi:peroxiredoxin
MRIMRRAKLEQFSQTMVLRVRARLLGRALALLLAAALAAQLLHGAVARELAGSEAPDFALKSISGENLRLSEFRSEVVALVFWASWCGECRSRLPGLQAMQQQLSGDGLRIVSVNLDQHLESARDSTKRLRVEFPVLFDERGQVSRLYELQELPALVLIDRDGRIRVRRDGRGVLDEDPLVQDIRQLLAE